MFTGIIQEIGQVQRIEKTSAGARLHIGASEVLVDTQPGQSIAVNGVCLTVTRLHAAMFEADVANQTLRRTNLGQLRPGASVHLETAMIAGGRFDGHIVSGHVDGCARFSAVQADGRARLLRFELEEPGLLRYCIERGSLALDGVSLTIFDLDDRTGGLSVSLIPHSQGLTRFDSLMTGERINVECDLLAKYTERLLRMAPSEASTASTASGASLSMATLQRAGFAR